MKSCIIIAVAVLFHPFAAGTLLEKAEATLLKLKTFQKTKELEAKLIGAKGTTTKTILGPVKEQEELQQVGPQRNGEVLLRPNLHMSVNDGFAWFSYGRNNFIPPVQVNDPNWEFAEIGWTAILIGSFNGPYGPVFYAEYSMEGTLTLPDGKKLRTGRITQSWASHPMYCGPQSPFADLCTPTVWKWVTLSNGCQDLAIYDPSDLKSPLLKISGMCTIPVIFYPVPDTTYYFPRSSAVRLFAMDLLTYIVDGFGTDGRPHVVQRALFDFDMQGIGVPATYDRIEGPAVENFAQYLIPLGFRVLPGGYVRTGVFSISPNQGSF